MRGPLITRFYTEVIHSRGKGKITSIHGGSRRVFTRSHLPVHPSITRDPKHFSNLIRLLAIQLSQILDVTPRFQSFWAFWALLYCSLLTNLRFCIILPIADNLVSSIFFSLIPPFIPSFLSNVREAIFFEMLSDKFYFRTGDSSTISRFLISVSCCWLCVHENSNLLRIFYSSFPLCIFVKFIL